MTKRAVSLKLSLVPLLHWNHMESYLPCQDTPEDYRTHPNWGYGMENRKLFSPKSLTVLLYLLKTLFLPRYSKYAVQHVSIVTPALWSKVLSVFDTLNNISSLLIDISNGILMLVFKNCWSFAESLILLVEVCHSLVGSSMLVREMTSDGYIFMLVVTLFGVKFHQGVCYCQHHQEKINKST